MRVLDMTRFIASALFSKRKKEMIKTLRDIRRYIPWRCALELSRVSFEGRSFDTFKRPDFAVLVARVLEDAGYGHIRNGMFYFDPSAASRIERGVTIKSILMAEIKPVFDRVISTLPEALEEGTKPLLYTSDVAEAKATFAKFLDNLAYRELRMFLVRDMARLDKLPASATILDVGSGTGADVLVLLEATTARIIATDPHDENLEILRSLVKIKHEEDRVTIVKAEGEELSNALARIGVESVDATVIVNVLHWASNPLRILREAGKVTRGVIALMQGTRDTATGRAMAVVTYLMGSEILPTAEEVEEMIELAGLKKVKKSTFPIEMYVLK